MGLLPLEHLEHLDSQSSPVALVALPGPGFQVGLAVLVVLAYPVDPQSLAVVVMVVVVEVVQVSAQQVVCCHLVL